MSWLSDNYEKVTLGAAVTALVALGYISFKNKGDQANAFNLPNPKQNNEVSVDGLADIETSKVSMYMEHRINQADLDGRKVDLFTGIVLFSKRDDPKNPVDLLKSDPVHAGIPNTWWMEHDLDPGYANAPDRDPDDDGFANREEFEAETDPNDVKDYPEPVTKLKTVEVKTTQVHLKPRDAGGDGKRSLFSLEDPRGYKRNRTKPEPPITIGDTIMFTKPYMQKRFKFVGLDRRRNANGVTDVIWIIEDLLPNKKGTQYRFDKRGDLDGHPGRSLGIMDSVVQLVLEALDEGGKPFEIEENTYFSLPYDEEAKQKPYLLKSIDLNERTIIVEYQDKEGNKLEHTMTY